MISMKLNVTRELIYMDCKSKEEMNNYYSRLLAEHGPVPAALAYKATKQQTKRYASLSNIEPIARTSSVLDVGSGLGHLCDYLRDAGWKGTYTGIDINPDLIAAAQQRLPNDQFILGDILEDDLGQNFDYVFCGATIQHKPKYCDPTVYLERMVRTMFGLAQKGVSFDIFSDKVDDHLDECLYADPNYLLSFCYTLTTRLALHNEMRPFELMVYLYKNCAKDEFNIYQDSASLGPVIV